MARILGIDPGSRVTGFGVIDAAAFRPAYVASGAIRLDGGDLADRLRGLFRQVQEVVEEYAPQEVAIERMYVHRNADSALKLGQARGVAICSAAMFDLPLAEYAPSRIKQAVVGRGGASKEQVQHMVAGLLSLSGRPQADAADALAVAVCHAHTRSTARRVSRAAGSSWRGFRP